MVVAMVADRRRGRRTRALLDHRPCAVGSVIEDRALHGAGVPRKSRSEPLDLALSKALARAPRGRSPRSAEPGTIDGRVEIQHRGADLEVQIGLESRRVVPR